MKQQMYSITDNFIKLGQFQHSNTVKNSSCLHYVLTEINQGLNSLNHCYFMTVSAQFKNVSVL